MEQGPHEPTSKKDDSFLDIFRKHHAVMLLIEPESGRILDANPAAERFYGYPLEELRGMDMAEINSLAKEQVWAGTDAERHLLVRPHKLSSGEIRTVEVQVSSVIVGGRLVEFAIIHDVTDRKKAEDALSASGSEMRSLLESMRDVVLVIDRDGIYRDIAPTNPELLYKPSYELLGRSLLDVFPAERAA